jgi:cytoskeletal protein CcmA (bactofilin family)
MLKLLKIKDESGDVLILTVVIISILTMLGAAFVNLITHDYRNADQQRRWIQAYYIAEAGMAKAWFTLKNDKDKGGVKGATSLGGLVGPLLDKDFGVGKFIVAIAENKGSDGKELTDDNILILTSMGKVPGVVKDVERKIEVTLAALPFVPDYAITTGGNFNISGNPTISGKNGTVHANGNITISGSPSISQDALASGSVKISGNPTIGGMTSSGVAIIPIPPVDPGFYKVNADYELRGDGGVYNVSTKTLTYPGTFKGWAYSNGKWSINGGEADGTYYIEGDANVSGNPGEYNPWKVTIIATGSIEISGTPKMQPYTKDLLFVAGRDIKIGGNSQTSCKGVILAHEQIELHGSPSIKGAIVAENAPDTGGPVTKCDISGDISGNVNIECDGGLNPPLPKIYSGQLGLLSWH